MRTIHYVLLGGLMWAVFAGQLRNAQLWAEAFLVWLLIKWVFRKSTVR